MKASLRVWTRGVSTFVLLIAAGVLATPAWATDPTRSYWVYACAESEDEVALIRFGPGGAQVEKTIPVGSFPAEIEGPHGLNVSPSGRYWYVTLAHGLPFGTVHKYRTGSDEWVGDVQLGLYPATLDISPSTGLMYVVNFNLHGRHEPSSISVVETSTMTEVARIPSGVMPHGSRLNRKGSKLYSVNMMDDDLVEVDALNFKIARRLSLGSGNQGAHHDSGPRVKPTWVTRPTADGKVFVAGNGSHTLFEVDLHSWTVARRFEAHEGAPYNLDVAPDGKTLLATYKKGKAVGFWDLNYGQEVARVATTRPVPHGVVISPDGQYAFVTVEGIGGEPGTVEVFSLAERRRVDAVDIGKQAGGIAFWKMEP